MKCALFADYLERFPLVNQWIGFSRLRDGNREWKVLSAALRARRWKSEIMRVALDPDGDDVELLLGHLPSLGDRNFVIAVRRAHLHLRQQRAVERILALVPAAAIVSAAEPFDALLWPAARTVACIYGDDAVAFSACADVLSGRAEADGHLPVTL